MEKDKISIVTVCYNSIESIEKTICSVIEQTYDNIEYIVIDGGSTDGTVEVIKKYAKHIDYWISAPDQGIYDAMNKGIKLAHGEWIHFRNSGDFFLNKKSLESFFETPIPNDVIVVHGNCLYYDENGWFEQTPPSLRVSYKEEIPVLHPAAFVRLKVQRQNPFDMQYSSSADYCFFYKCCEMGYKFEYRPIAIVAFARGGFSSNWERAYFEDCRIQGKFDRIGSRIRVYCHYYNRKLREFIKSFLMAIIPSYRKKKENMRLSVYSPYPFNTDFLE